MIAEYIVVRFAVWAALTAFLSIGNLMLIKKNIVTVGKLTVIWLIVAIATRLVEKFIVGGWLPSVVYLSAAATFIVVLVKFLISIRVITKLRSFALESRRVLAVTRKPTKDELGVIIKVTGIGIVIIGLIGFVLQLGQKMLF